MTEPRYLLIDLVSGVEVKITTAELRSFLLNFKIKQPHNEAYIEYQPKGNSGRTEHSLPLVQRNNGR